MARVVASATIRERFAPHRVYAVLGVLSMMALMILTPPFQFADEPQHIKRSFGLAQGALWVSVRDDKSGIYAPASLPQSIKHYFLPERSLGMPLAETLRELERPLAPEQTAFVQIRREALYAPPDYAPQAGGVLLGRMLGLGPVWLLYLARLFNLLIAAALITGAIRVMPFGREAALWVALLPMTQAQLASASPDALTIACGFVFAAVLAKSLEKRAFPWQRLVLMALSGLLLCASKVVYAPLLAAGLVVLGARDLALRKRLGVAGFSLALTVVAVIAGLVWVMAVNDLLGDIPTGADPERQMAGLLADPPGFLAVLGATLADQAKAYSKSFLGVLGWSNLTLPIWVYALIAAAAPLALLAARSEPAGLPKGSLVWFAVLIAAAALFIELALYITWTPVGAPQVLGVQGRYFLPLAPLAVYGLARLAAPARRVIGPDLSYGLMIGLMATASLAAIYQTVRFFGLTA